MTWAVTRLMGFGLTLCLGVAGCGGGSGGQSTTNPPAATSTVNLVVTDTPSTKLTVLSFQVQITGAVLQPGAVSLLPLPVTVDLAKLVSDTGFLASTVVGLSPAWLSTRIVGQFIVAKGPLFGAASSVGARTLGN